MLKQRQTQSRTLSVLAVQVCVNTASVEDMPRVLNGLGIAIVSTSKGIMTDRQLVARMLVVRYCATFINRF